MLFNSFISLSITTMSCNKWLNNDAHTNSYAKKQLIVLYNKNVKTCALLPFDILTLSIRSVQSNSCGKLVPDEHHHYALCLYEEQQNVLNEDF